MPKSIRTLVAGEQVPTSEPGRFPDADGYIRLRWKIAPATYVEAREHRIVEGIVTDAPHRHHVNRVRDDNRPDNLVSLDPSAHAQLHNHPTFDVAQAHRLYQEGWSGPLLARLLGVHHTVIYRAFRRRGLGTRPKGTSFVRENLVPHG